MDPIFNVIAIAGVLALLWLTLRLLQGSRLRGAWGRTAENPLQVRQRLPLVSGWNLVLVRWNDQELLLAAGAQQCVLMSSQNSGPSPAPQFAQQPAAGVPFPVPGTRPVSFLDQPPCAH